MDLAKHGLRKEVNKTLQKEANKTSGSYVIFFSMMDYKLRTKRLQVKNI